MTKVVVGFCHRADSLSPQFRRSLTMLLMREAATTRRVIGEIDQESSANISGARCEIVRQFLANPAQPEWLWMIDTDMTFADNILDQLLATAHRTDRPIVGGLCFGVRPIKVNGVEQMNEVLASPLELYPTIFTLNDEGGMQRWAGYPVNSVVQVHSTGAACLLIHRRVLADKRWTDDGHPLPWFRESVLNGGLCSEDHFFCLRAGSFGYPIHLDTSAKTGHVKCFVADESAYMAQIEAPPATECVDVIVPVLRRPQNAEPFMRSLRATTGLASVLAVAEPGDVETIDAWREAGALVWVDPHAHTFSEKVNAGYAVTESPWLLLVGDDVRFRPSWLDHALHVAHLTGAKVIGTNDLGNEVVMRGDHSCHPLIARDYVDEHGASWDGPKVVCHEGYRHWFVDNELVTVAKQREVWAMALASKVEHMHPLWGKGNDDEVYRMALAGKTKDERLFAARRKAYLL